MAYSLYTLITQEVNFTGCSVKLTFLRPPGLQVRRQGTGRRSMPHRV